MKYLLFISLTFVVLGLTAQDAYVRNGKKIVGLGDDTDVLIESSVVNYSIELVEKAYGVLIFAVEAEKVSGNVEFTAYLQESMNNKNWSNLDTITYSGGESHYEEFELVNANHVNYRVNINATATEQESTITIWGKLSDGFIIQ